MAYSAPSTRSTGELCTAAIWNADVVANEIAIYAGALSLASQASGDILYASSTTQFGRVGIGTANKVLTSSGSAPQWSTQLVNAALPTNIDVGGTLDVTGDTTLDGDIVVTGAGPHSIGGATIGYVGTIFGGSFTSSGASTTLSGILTNQTLTGASGDTGSIVGSRFASALTTQTATESIAHIAQVHIEDPQITDNLTGDITIAASLYIKNAPTEGETNAALYVAAGTTYFGGNVGVSVTDPGVKLEVSGDCGSYAENNAQVQIIGSTDKNMQLRMGYRTDTTNGYGWLQAVRAGTDQVPFILQAEGNKVGIGAITAPDGTLHVHTATAGSVTAGSTADDLVVENSGSCGMTFLSPSGAYLQTIAFGDVGDHDSGRIIYDHDSNTLQFWTEGAERMRIDSAGDVGIATSNPTHKLHVTGDIKLQSSQVHLSDGYGLLWGDNGVNGSAAADSLRFDTAGGQRLGIDSAGLVLVGNNLSVVEFIQVGTTSASTGINSPKSTYFNCDSDANATGEVFIWGTNRATTSGGTELMRLTDAGRLGIGSSDPGSLLELSNPAGAAQLTIQAGTSDSVTGEASIKLISRNSGSGSSPPAEIRNIWGGSNDSDLAFYTTTDGSTMVEQMRIMDNGYIGMGTASPSFPLHISTIDSHIKIESTTGTNSTSVKATNTGGTLTFGIEENTGGNLVIGSSAYEGVIAHAGSYGLSLGTDNSRRLTISSGGTVNVVGTFTAGVKTFRIPHPLPEKNDTHHLIHGCLEGPRLDLIYRSTVTLVAGSATVDLDEAAGMTAGTWALLCRDAQVFTTNETGWFHVRGTVSGSTLTIECEEGTCTDTVSWMVVAERQDDAIKGQSSTDEDGHLILEPLQVENPSASASPSA